MNMIQSANDAAFDQKAKAIDGTVGQLAKELLSKPKVRLVFTAQYTPKKE